jgi:uncharacterized protein
MLDAETIKRMLRLAPLPGEGGFYRETWRSRFHSPTPWAANDPEERRSLGTAIYYLLETGIYSAFHRVPGVEIFHFYLGDPVELIELDDDSPPRVTVLGTDIVQGMNPQHVVGGGIWQAARLRPGGRFALMGTTVTPGFEFGDFELGQRVRLTERYPAAVEFIEALCR